MPGLLGSASTLGIGLAVYMDDQFTQAASRVSNTLRLMGKDLDDFSQGMQTLSSIGDGLAGIGSKIYGFGKDATQQFATFEHSINATRVIAGIKKTDIGYKQLGDTALRLSAIYGQLPDAIGNAELELAKGGKSVLEINKMTEAVVALGAATQTPVEGAYGTSAVLMNIMQAYNASSAEAVHYADIITSAANQSTIDVRDLFESLKYSADVASTLNIPFQETAASIATLGNAGLKGSMAGTAYANMLRYLESGIGIFATKRQKTALGLLGLSKSDMTDEKGHLISMGNLLKIIGDRTKSFNDTDKLAVLGGIFGIRGNRAMLNLLKGRAADSNGNMMSAYDAMVDKMGKDVKGNITRKTAQDMLDDTAGNWTKLTTAWVRFKIEVGGTLAKTFSPFIQFFTKLIDGLTNFVSGPIGSWLMKWGIILGSALLPIGRMLSIGARFMGFIVGSAGRLTNAFKMADVASLAIRAQLVAGAASIEKAALLAKGITGFNSAQGAMLIARGAGGRFAGGAVERTFLSRGLGMAFGKSGLKFASTIERFIGPLIEAGTWLGKTLGFVKVFGGLLGKALGWLFGWEAMLVDLGLTMLTGKGIFEWLWAGLKAVFGWLFDSPETKKTKREFAHSYKRTEEYVPIYRDNRTAQQKALQDELDKKYPMKGKEEPRPILLNLTVHAPATLSYQKQLEINHERELQSYSILK